jgi:peptide/nickel transport system substrate-binding protein
MRYVAEVLDRLGYRASVRVIRGDHYFAAVRDNGHRPQGGGGYWGADYPAASNFVDPLFSCRAARAPGDQRFNLSRFCERGSELLALRAKRLERDDPARANAGWARADRRLVDRGAAVPLTNPRSADLLSSRVGHFVHSPEFGVLYDQLWVR